VKADVWKITTNDPRPKSNLRMYKKQPVEFLAYADDDFKTAHVRFLNGEKKNVNVSDIE
jgi:hypothetical protein